MRSPCEEAQIRSATAASPCAKNAEIWILAATILGSSMTFIDGTVVNVALPAIQASFHATLTDVQWVVESYGLLLGALILAGGSLGDLFGRRRIFLIGVGVFAAASLGCGIAASISQLVIARSVQGFGAALLVPGGLAIISASFDEKRRGKAIGTWSGFTAITTAIGPLLGGWLVQHASWRWAFLINLPLAVVVIAISLSRVPESRSHGADPMDWRGTVFCVLGLGGLVNGFMEAANLGWQNPIVFGSLVVGVASLVAFTFVEANSTSPIVSLALFKSRSFSGANLLTLFLYSAIGIFFFLFPLNLIQVQGYSPTATGAALLPLIVLMFFLSRWSGGLVAHYGPEVPLIAGPIIAGAGFLLFAVPSVGGSYWKTFFPAIVVLGFGMTVTVAPLTTVVMNSVNRDHAGAASGINNAVARIAGVLAIAVLGIVMVSAFSSRLNQRLSHSSLPLSVVYDIESNEIKLAGIQLPDRLNPAAKAEISESIAHAFVFGFRIVMLICAGMSLAGGLVAKILIDKRTP